MNYGEQYVLTTESPGLLHVARCAATAATPQRHS